MSITTKSISPSKIVYLPLIFLGVALASGCAVTADGIGPTQRAPDPTQEAKAREELQRHADAAAANSASNGESAPVSPGVVVIGTTGPLRNIEDGNREGFYAAYLKVAGQMHPGSPAAMSETQFQEKLAGWASLQIAGIPGIGNIRLRMLVPASVIHDAQFASTAGSFLFGTTGDLVAARSDDDGLLWLERVLCRDEHGYSTCAKDYQTGVFDKNTGQALDKNRKPKPRGPTMDTVSYKVIGLPKCSAGQAMREDCFDNR